MKSCDVTHQVIESVADDHGVGVQNMGMIPFRVQFEVRTHGVIVHRDLLSAVDGFADEINVPEKFRVHRFVRGQAADLVQVQVLPEMDISQVTELFHQVLPGLMRHVPAVEDAVDEPAQLRVGKLLVIVKPGVIGFIV